MRKFIFVLIAVLSISSIAWAQEDKPALLIPSQTKSFEIAPVLGIPFLGLSDGWGIGYGGSARGLYWINNDVALTGGIGYVSFPGSSSHGPFGVPLPNCNVTSIVVGGRYNNFISSAINMYEAADLGIYFVKHSASETDFGFAPALGVRFKAGNNFNLFAEARLEYIFGKGPVIVDIGGIHSELYLTRVSWFGITMGMEF